MISSARRIFSMYLLRMPLAEASLIAVFKSVSAIALRSASLLNQTVKGTSAKVISAGNNGVVISSAGVYFTVKVAYTGRRRVDAMALAGISPLSVLLPDI